MAGFSSHTSNISQQTKYNSRCENQLSSIKQYRKERRKNVNVTLLTIFFVLEYIFHNSMLFIFTFNELFKMNTPFKHFCFNF